ncbi:sugar ABC transporter substrate-binding protein [Sporosarcina beigongshangi]|uniref:sugar ABC transporter substrate-binding protein n=1 Tax=Sporosarcina beigongshangi TaxID=2782538 RepID=UPI0019399BA6|nr:substrate-binding domain-containing protein [Sporosarcina beigongshangi]
MKKTRKNLLITGLLAFSLVVTGCSNGTGSSDASGEKEGNEAFNPDNADGQTFEEVRESLGEIPKVTEEVKLGAVAKAFENEYWRTLKEGMEIGTEKFSDEGVNLTIDVKSPQGESDEEGQLSIVKDMINKKYTAMLLSPISDGNLVPGVESANEAGIPVINVNDGIIKEAPNFIGPKADQNGASAAEWISGKINGEGKVAIIVGMPKAFAARQRTIGFEEWMKDNAPDIEIAEKQNADWDRSKAKDIAATWIKKHDDLKAIFANNDTMALGAQEAVNDSGKDILVVGVDGIGEAYDSIRKGEMDATIDSFPLYKGQIAVEMILRQLGGQELPRVIWTPQALIDATNVDTPAEEIINWTEPVLAK